MEDELELGMRGGEEVMKIKEFHASQKKCIRQVFHMRTTEVATNVPTPPPPPSSSPSHSSKFGQIYSSSSSSQFQLSSVLLAKKSNPHFGILDIFTWAPALNKSFGQIINKPVFPLYLSNFGTSARKM